MKGKVCCLCLCASVSCIHKLNRKTRMYLEEGWIVTFVKNLSSLSLAPETFYESKIRTTCWPKLFFNTAFNHKIYHQIVPLHKIVIFLAKFQTFLKNRLQSHQIHSTYLVWIKKWQPKLFFPCQVHFQGQPIMCNHLGQTEHNFE